MLAIKFIHLQHLQSLKGTKPFGDILLGNTVTPKYLRFLQIGKYGLLQHFKSKKETKILGVFKVDPNNLWFIKAIYKSFFNTSILIN